MKKRVRKIANFFAFNLLFFALYLNFIHKDSNVVVESSIVTGQMATPAFSETVKVENPERSSNTIAPAAADQKSASNTVALKLSIN